MNKAVLFFLLLVSFYLAYFSLTSANVGMLTSKSKKYLEKSIDYPSREELDESLSANELEAKALEDQVAYQKMMETDKEFNHALANLQEELGGNEKKGGKGEVVTLSEEDETSQLDETSKVEQETLPGDPYFQLTPSEIASLNNSGSPNANNGLIGGVHNPSTGGAGLGELDEEPASAAEAFQELPQLVGQPRGYVMLYLMHPKARETVNAQVEGLIVAGIRNLYLSVLIDGTFGNDFEFLKNNIKKLSSNSDSLTLVLYLSNGATMRLWDQTSIVAGFNTIEPRVFRELIQFEERAKEEFGVILNNAKDIFSYNSSLSSNNKNIAIVMLEDNLQKQSYIAMRNLAKKVLGNSVEYVRNPCPGCYPGNDVETDGDAIEIHDPEAVFDLQSGNAFTNDGKSYRFSGEPAKANSLLISDLEDRMLMADARGGKYFGLWRAERQGYTSPPIHPDERNYEVPTVKQLITELRMLRSGLQEVDEDS